MKNISFTLFLVCLLTASFAQQNEQTLEEITAIENNLFKSLQIKGQTINKYNIAERMEHHKVPGVSIALVENGRIKWSKGYGYANTESKTKVDSETLFQAGSISKPIAALAALKLYETGQMALDTDINRYLKNWQVPDNEFTTSEKVTLERLLTHTAGTTVHGFPGYQQTDSFPSIIDVLKGDGNTGSVTVDTMPGSLWRYSGGGYTIMEKAVEDVSGLSLEDYMSTHILPQIGMTHSTYEQPISESYQSNISAAYDGDGQLITGLWNNYPEQAAAGLWTTPSDLALYCIEIQEILNGKDDGVLSKATIDKMLTKHQNDWGLGPSLRNEGEDLIFGHGGKNAGFTNNMTAFAHKGRALIIMTNADNGGKLMGEIQNSISEHYDWSISQIQELEVIELADDKLEEYVGKYLFEAQGLNVEFQIKDGQLFANSPVGILKLLPMTDTKFIDIDSGTKIEFLIDEKVTGFRVNDSFELVRVE